jgi:hypothetical protein
MESAALMAWECHLAEPRWRRHLGYLNREIAHGIYLLATLHWLGQKECKKEREGFNDGSR